MSATAPQAVITWIPPGGTNVINQTVYYKQAMSTTWLTLATVPATQNSYTTTIALTPNTLYDFRVSDNCSVGGTAYSNVDESILFSCPPVTTTHTYSTIDAQFTMTNVNDINKIDIQVLDATETTVIATQTILAPGNLTYTKSFTGFAAATTYKVRLKFYANGTLAFTNVCTAVSVTTDAAPACVAPTSVVANMS